MKEPIHVITISTYAAEDTELSKALVMRSAKVESSSHLGATATWVAETIISNKMKVIFGKERENSDEC